MLLSCMVVNADNASHGSTVQRNVYWDGMKHTLQADVASDGSDNENEGEF